VVATAEQAQVIAGLGHDAVQSRNLSESVQIWANLYISCRKTRTHSHRLVRISTDSQTGTLAQQSEGGAG
jgi:hypothetical protein